MKNKITEKRMNELLSMKLWSIDQTAEYLGVKIGSLRNMATRGEIPGLKRINGKKWFIHVETFIAFFNSVEVQDDNQN